MELVTRSNIFEWGDMYFLQLLGTAMGTSATCICGLLSTSQCMKLKRSYQNIINLRSSSTVLLMTCLESRPETTTNGKTPRKIPTTWGLGILTWEFEDLASSVNFLDLTISIEDSKIITKIYQKALNLYQYLGPQSAHPPKMIKGVIYSLLKTYHQQNSRESDYNAIVAKTFNRYCNRGWNRAILKGYILDADQRVKSTVPKVPPPAAPPSETPLPNNKETLYIHMEYHPNDIPRHRVRAIFNHYCQELFKDRLDITQSIVAYSRPPNIKDTVTKAKLHQAPGRNASKFYSGELP